MESKKVIVPMLSSVYPELFNDDELEAFNVQFDQMGRPLSLDNRPWAEYPDRPDVTLRIACSDEYLFVKFYVKERETLGRYENDNEPMYLDSCVEIFLSPEGAGHYYNFEFNCLGNCLAQVGPDRANREVLDPGCLEKIVRVPSLGQRTCCIHNEGTLTEIEPWNLLVAIPLSCFIKDDLNSFKGQKFTGNFYKCGDDLSIPHYLSWSRIETESPDFHRPEYFGEIWIN